MVRPLGGVNGPQSPSPTFLTKKEGDRRYLLKSQIEEIGGVGTQGPPGPTGPQGPLGPQGLQGPAGQDGIGGTSNDILSKIFTFLYLTSNNTAPIDVVEEIAPNIIFMAYFDNHDFPINKPSTKSYTVPAGKRLNIVGVFPSEVMRIDPNNRRVSLLNITDGTQIIPDAFQYSNFQSVKFPILVFDGQELNSGYFGAYNQLVVNAGKTIRLEIWNSNTLPRGMGGAVLGILTSR